MNNTRYLRQHRIYYHIREKQMFKKTCIGCGAEFIPKHSNNQKYCSESCRERSRNHKYYMDHKEHVQKRHKKYYLDHKEHIQEMKKKYNQRKKCEKKHNGCFNCPTEDGECLYD